MTSSLQMQRETETAAKQIINLMGSYFILEDDQGAQRTVRGVIASITNEDKILINSFGVESSLFYCLPVTPLPNKFDRIILNGGIPKIIQAVHEIVINNVTVVLKMVLNK